MTFADKCKLLAKRRGRNAAPGAARRAAAEALDVAALPDHTSVLFRRKS
jgi:hypothetical protein